MFETDAILFTSRGFPVGILARQNRGFLFYSASLPLASLDGVTYQSVQEARLAVHRRVEELEIPAHAQSAAA